MTASIPSLLQPLKDRLAAAREWDVCDGEQTVRSETGEILYDRSGYDRSEWVGEYRPIAELIAAAPTDQAKLIAAIEAVEELCVILETHHGGARRAEPLLAHPDAIRAMVKDALGKS